MKKQISLCIIIILLAEIRIQSQPPRLKNFGATCFQNATIQALYNIEPLTNVLANNPNPYQQNSLPYLYTQLVTQLRQQDPQSTAHYEPLLKSLGVQGYVVVEQCTPLEGCSYMNACRHEDATEFMAGLLNSLMIHDPAFTQPQYQRNPKLLLQDHPIGNVLRIETDTIISCSIQTNNTLLEIQKDKIEPLSYLNVEARRIEMVHGQLQSTHLNTLAQCLNNFFTREQLNDPQNYYLLDLTQEELRNRPELAPYNRSFIPNCAKTIRLAHTSDIVIIALKRFTYSPFTGQLIKLNQSITIPQILNFGPYMVTGTAPTYPNYQLIGVIRHIGQAGFGHYIAYVKTNNTWYECNDENIYRRTLQQIQYHLNQGYVFIYQKMAIAPEQPPAGQLVRALDNLAQALNALQQTLQRR